MSIYQEEHQIFRQSVRKFVESAVIPQVNHWEANHNFPSEIFQTLGAQGFLGILIDENWGGVGGDYALASAWCEEFGRVPSVGFSIAVNMHSLVITPALARHGSEESKERWLRAATAGKAIGAYAFTEPNAGSDLTNIQTKAVRRGDKWVLNGAKTFITNGRRANFVLVLAKTDQGKGYDGYTTFVVDTSLPGFSCTRTLSKLGWHASDTAELTFNDIELPESSVLGSEGRGWHQAMESLQWERLMLTLSAIGGARACLEDTIRYVKERRVFGKTLAELPYTQDLLARLWSRLESGRALTHHAVQLLLNGERCRLESSLAKLNVCELAIEIADRCLQLHGGYGYTTEYSPERWLRDLRLNTIGGGTSQIMARIAAKELFS